MGNGAGIVMKPKIKTHIRVDINLATTPFVTQKDLQAVLEKNHIPSDISPDGEVHPTFGELHIFPGLTADITLYHIFYDTTETIN